MEATRRQVLQVLAMLPALVGARRALAAPASGAPSPRSASSHATLAEILPAPESPVGPCTFVGVGPLENGALTFDLRSPGGETFRVNALRHDPATPGIARAGDISFYLVNGGAGDKRTIEQHGLGVMALAQVLSRRPARVVIPGLRTLRQRAALLAS
jgi:hypothetical protein